MGKGPLIALITGILLLGGMIGFHQYSQRKSRPAGRTEARNLKEALEDLPGMIRPKLPIMVDSISEVYDIETTDSMILYYCRILTLTAGSIDTTTVLNGFKEELIHRVCGSDEMTLRFLSEGITIRYLYHDMNKQQFGFLDVLPSDCGY